MKRKITVLTLSAMLFNALLARPRAAADEGSPDRLLKASLQYSNLYYVAPVLFRAHRNIFSQSVQYWTETSPESA